VLLVVAVVDSSETDSSPEKRLCGVILESVRDDGGESVFRRVVMFEFELDSKPRLAPTNAVALEPTLGKDRFSCLRSLEYADIEQVRLV
jgi:hypothetical protein